MKKMKRMTTVEKGATTAIEIELILDAEEELVMTPKKMTKKTQISKPTIEKFEIK